MILSGLISAIPTLIGMIPEGLFLLTSVALAVSVVRLAQNRTLIHEMNAIETLARVDVLCVDKTGTVTSPQMQVREVVPLDPEVLFRDGHHRHSGCLLPGAGSG